MHTFEGRGAVFQHNGFASGGEVVLIIKKGPAQAAHEKTFEDHGDHVSVRVLTDDLLAFVAAKVRGDRISVIEQAEDAEILGIPPGR